MALQRLRTASQVAARYVPNVLSFILQEYFLGVYCEHLGSIWKFRPDALRAQSRTLSLIDRSISFVQLFRDRTDFDCILKRGKKFWQILSPDISNVRRFQRAHSRRWSFKVMQIFISRMGKFRKFPWILISEFSLWYYTWIFVQMEHL